MLEKHAKQASHARCLRLAQVHRARLLTGEQVVLKVQRPGLRQLFDIDLKNLEKVRRRWVPQLSAGSRIRRRGGACSDMDRRSRCVPPH